MSLQQHERVSLSEFQTELAELLVTRGRLAAPPARQVVAVITAHVEDYLRDRGEWTVYEKLWDSKHERAWLEDVQQCAKDLETALSRRRSEGLRMVGERIVILPSAMDAYGLSAPAGMEWLKFLQQYTTGLLEAWRRAPKTPHRPADLWRRQLEVQVALEVREAGIRLTTARTGVLALVFEKVFAVIGLGEIDPHKSVRRACERVARLSSRATVPEPPSK